MSFKRFGAALLAVLLVLACSGKRSLVNEDDPFDDPFFSDGLGGGDSLDAFLREPAPSVGWLAREGAVPPTRSARERAAELAGEPLPAEGGVLLEAEGGESGEGVYGDDPYGDEDDANARARARGEKSFYERASEATLATMSVLVGAGMAALPFLVGT
ncbi:MAG TPA: hypothetical protein VIS07_21600 [Candidatus Binatia bacterium]